MNRLLCVCFLLCTINAWAQKSSKEMALDEFKKEHYKEAISLLEKAVRQDSTDAELYYYLGFFNHYLAYDSRPLRGYDEAFSQKIFHYLDRAIDLKPDYGDALYFYGAQCSGGAFGAMQDYDIQKVRYFWNRANERGSYPDWLKEFGRNILNSCDKNAILFTAGNVDFDVCSYLQVCQGVRRDITVIPIGNIDRPWYVKFLRDGLNGCSRKVNVSLTDRQIMDIHPFKWRTTTIDIGVWDVDKKNYRLPQNYCFKWTVEPDLVSERMHSKVEGEAASQRTYLSVQRAMLLEIVESNFACRPIYFSNFAQSSFWGGLDAHFQNEGLVSRLLPVGESRVNVESFERLLCGENLNSFATIKQSNIPRISGVIHFGYYNAFLTLAEKYRGSGNKAKIEPLVKLFSSKMLTGLDPEWEAEILSELKGK